MSRLRDARTEFNHVKLKCACGVYYGTINRSVGVVMLKARLVLQARAARLLVRATANYLRRAQIGADRACWHPMCVLAG